MKPKIGNTTKRKQKTGAKSTEYGILSRSRKLKQQAADASVFNNRIQKEAFGTTPDGQPVDRYTMTNCHGVEVKILTYGGIVSSLKIPGTDHRTRDVVLGYDTLEEYIQDPCYFGGIIGRCTNRIAEGVFKLNGQEYRLLINGGRDHLHGGFRGFSKVVWEAKPLVRRPALRLSYLSQDKEEGYPGNLFCTVEYQLTDDNELLIHYFAETDADTIVNLTNHSYFNLAGHDSGNILNHKLTLNADHCTVKDENHIPTGKIESVKNTALDFTQPASIGARINTLDLGYDHNYIIKRTNGSLTFAASVYEPVSHCRMDVFTTQPGVHLYTGNLLNGVKGKEGAVYHQHGGFALETQHYPDSPNRPEFPSVVLKTGEKYRQCTIYKFCY